MKATPEQLFAALQQVGVLDEWTDQDYEKFLIILRTHKPRRRKRQRLILPRAYATPTDRLSTHWVNVIDRPPEREMFIIVQCQGEPAKYVPRRVR